MKPLRVRLQEARQRLGVPWEVVERDYLLSWVLAGIARTDGLRDTLVFKGGTALKKCYFGDYRFSEDLDYSGIPGAPTGDAMEHLIEEACREAVQLLAGYAPVAIGCERYVEKNAHPGGQEAFTIRGKLPWHRQPTTRIMVEISMDEAVIRPVQERRVIHDYGEPINADVKVYALEEIIGEKLRAILQHIAMLDRRGWARSRARDYYDLWRILRAHQAGLDFSGFSSFVQRKCEVRGVGFSGAEDFFQEPMISHVHKTWKQWLGPLVPGLPTFDLVVGELRPRLERILGVD